LSTSKTILTTQGLRVGYNSAKEEKVLFSRLDLKLNKGELTCLLGPNGSGKSTLIRTLTGIQKPLSGTVSIAGRQLDTYSQKELARSISLVLTDRNAPGNLTGYALVSLGRFPYTSWMGSLGEADKERIHQAMASTGTLAFANRHIGELSDGERQKIMIARALVQDTEMIFLDEPTAHLDLPNRIEIFHLLRELAHQSDKAILLSTHEMNMALSSADKLWLVTNEQAIATGLPEDLVLSGELEKSFTRESLVFDYKTGGFLRKHEVEKRAVAISGPEILCQWTRSALERNGFKVMEEAYLRIDISGTRESPEWATNQDNKTYKTIEQLLLNI
jgi:iron complex transport system ATP-binding protein